jgi:hypothetical protein
LAFKAEDRYATSRDFAEALSLSAEAASAGLVADWVQRLAEKPLLERARLLAQVENWDDGSAEIELSSTPFAVERDVLEHEDTGEHSTKSAHARSGQRLSRPTPLPPNAAAATAVEAPIAQRPTAALARRSEWAGLQLLIELPGLKALLRQLPPDPRVRLGIAAGTITLLVSVVYLLLR